jgi:acyl-CoA thioester hydrolase
MNPRFSWPIRVYYEDTDAGGVVYHANYVRYFERARTERLRALGFELDELQRREGIIFVIRSMQIDFLKPARFNNELWATADLDEVRPASLHFRQALLRGADEVLCQASVKVVCLAAEAFRPKPLPDFLLQRLKNEL